MTVGHDVVYAVERFQIERCGRRLVYPPSERARFEQMLDRHHRRLRRMVAGVIADPDRIDDVLQEGYLRAYRRLPRQFANEAHEATWFYRVIYRCCLDELRRRRRRREIPSPHVGLRTVSAEEPFARIALDDAFRALVPADRAVLLLVGVLGLDQAAAAEILGIPVGTLGWRVSVARARLREALWPDRGRNV